MPTRRLLLTLSSALPLALAGCGGGGPPPEPVPLPPLVTGYAHLTPLRLNVQEIEIPPAPPEAVLVAEPVPLRPEAEMRRMAQERLFAVGTEGSARFLITAARFTRERLPAQGGFFGGNAQPGERLACQLTCRIEVLSGEGQRTGFIEAEARRTRTVAEGTSAAGRLRAAEDLVRQAMDELNVEVEFQIRRALRNWLVETPTPGTAPAPAPVQQEELPAT